jgi:hypothetical protein
VFAVDRQQHGAGFVHRIHEQLAGHDQRFLVGQQHLLAGARRRQRWRQPAAPTMAAITLSTSGALAMLHSACSPHSTSVFTPAARSSAPDGRRRRPCRPRARGTELHALRGQFVHAAVRRQRVDG